MTDPRLRAFPESSWNHAAARVLMDRAGFSAPAAEVERAVRDGLNTTVERLVQGVEESEEFRQSESLLRQVALDASSIESLKEWWLYRFRYSRNPLREKMTLFWHSHFATSFSKVQSVPWMVAQNDLFRSHATGDFRRLLHGTARDVAMLVWLDGNSNRKRQPNENFAREVMELFSLGVGNYSEQDIQEAARAFSGWHVREGRFWFNRLQHDSGSKTVFGQSGSFDGDDIIDLCLAQPACSRFLAGKLLRFFVKPVPEDSEVDSVALLIEEQDYQMDRVLAELFRSRLFFDSGQQRELIKSPVELLIGTQRLFGVQSRFDANRQLLVQLGQDLFLPPTVKGWEGQRHWISSATLLLRSNYLTELVWGSRYGRANIPHVAGTDEQLQSDDLTELCRQILGTDLSAKTKQEISKLAVNQTDLRPIILLILHLPEFQLC